MRKTLALLAVLAATALPAAAQSFSEEFVTVLPVGWVNTNNSTPAGTNPTWFQGNSTVFPANTGGPTEYAAANFNAVAGANTISLWLLTPQKTFINGDTLTFFTRTVTTPAFGDRLQVRLSLAGASTNVGATNTSVGDFTTLLLDINPTYVPAGYPNVWTQQSITLAGLPAGVQSGRFAFRYFVENGGPSGANSDFIGIDTLVFTSSTPVELQNFSIE